MRTRSNIAHDLRGTGITRLKYIADRRNGPLTVLATRKAAHRLAKAKVSLDTKCDLMDLGVNLVVRDTPLELTRDDCCRVDLEITPNDVLVHILPIGKQ